jgi:hypothetical protein
MTSHLSRSAALALLALATAAPAHARGNDCDEDCLVSLAYAYMNAVVAKDPSRLPWAQPVAYTESGVHGMIGEMAWGTITAFSDSPLIIADRRTHEVVWYGIVEEHGQPAYYGMRIKAEGRGIAEVETLFARSEEPTPFADTADFSTAALDAVVPDDERTGRRRMRRLVRKYYDTREQNDGEIETTFADDCSIIENGASLTEGDYWAAQAAEGCQAQYAIGVWLPVDRIRDRRIVAVDVERGLVAAISFEDYPAHYVTYQTTDGQTLKVETEYPNTKSRFEIFKIVDGAIARVEGVTTPLPYYMPSGWEEEE